MTSAQTDYDSPWKEALERFFEPFMAFFFPVAHAGIDWTRGYAFKDKELQRVVRDASLGRRWADHLTQVWLRDGSEAWVLVHIEVQGQVDPDFPRRMYTYNYRMPLCLGTGCSTATTGAWRAWRYWATTIQCGDRVNSATRSSVARST